MRIAGDAPGSKWGDKMGYDMTMKRGRWPQIKTYHPDDPFALWREPDGRHYQLDRFCTKLLKLQEAMKTPSGRARAAHRIAFLHLYLQELQHELAIGGSGYDMRTEVVHSLLRRKYGGEEQKEEQQIEGLQRGRVINMSRLSRKQHEV